LGAPFLFIQTNHDGITEIVGRKKMPIHLQLSSSFRIFALRTIKKYMKQTKLWALCAIFIVLCGICVITCCDEVNSQGYRLKIYDAYRPQKAVDHFVRWAANLTDKKMEAYFYPDLDKSVLFEQEYIMEKSGHTRGSTVDLTLFDMTTEKELDMGGTFDWFGPESHPDFCGNPETGEYTGDNHKSPKGRSITAEQFEHRMILRRAMLAHGFKPLDTEWRHFTLKDEPYPDTYFTFPVKQLAN